MSFAKIPLNLIKEGKFKVRRYSSPEEMAKLRDSIRKHGDVLAPIPVRPTKDGFELLGGHRRLQAAREAGLKEVTARVFKPKSEEEAWRICWQEDVLKEPWTEMDKARAVQKMKEDGISVTDIAIITGLSKEKVENYLDLLKLPDEVQSLVEKGELPPSHARELVGLKGEEAVELASKASTEKWTRDRLREELAKLKKPEIEEISPKEAKFEGVPAPPKIEEISAKEARIEEISKPSRVEPVEYFYVDCPTCKQVFEIAHMSDGTHKFKEVRGRLE